MADLAAHPSLELIRRLPKVLLHEHLDGGLRPATVVELAAEAGYEGLPTEDPEEDPIKTRVSYPPDEE